MRKIILSQCTVISVRDETKGLDHLAMILGRDAETGAVLAADNTPTNKVAVRPLRAVTKGRPFRVVPMISAYSHRQIAERALARQGQPYDPALYNCEHYVTDCVTGAPTSRQLHGVVAGASIVALALLVAANANASPGRSARRSPARLSRRR